MKVKGEQYMIGLRRFIFRAPPPWATVSVTVAVTLALVYLISGIYGMVLIGVAYALVNLMDMAAISLTREYFPLRRVILLNSINAVLTLGYAIGFRLFSIPTPLPLFLSHWAYLRFLTYTTFLRRHGVAVSIAPAVALLPLVYAVGPWLLPDYALLTAVTLALAAITVRAGERPLIEGLGVSPRVFIRDFVNHLTRQDEESLRALDDFFAGMYRKETREIYALWLDDIGMVFPYVHPGPFGRIGSSDIVNRAEAVLDGKLLVFHTTTTHDDNTTTDGLNLLLKALRGAEREEIDGVSPPVRFRADGVEVLYQRWGHLHLIALVPGEVCFDDVKYGVFRRIKEALGDAVVVDAHSSFDMHSNPLEDVHLHGLPEVELCHEWRAGYGERRVDHPSLGDGGVRVLLVETCGRRFAYILLDGNNVLEEVRRRIKEGVSGLVDDAEVFSTDNHTVNFSLVDVNPVGAGGDPEPIIRAAVEAVEDAIRDLRERRAWVARASAEIPVGGDGFLEKLEVFSKKAIAYALTLMGLSAATYILLCALITLCLL